MAGKNFHPFGEDCRRWRPTGGERIRQKVEEQVIDVAGQKTGVKSALDGRIKFQF